jgi:hypothetical protein
MGVGISPSFTQQPEGLERSTDDMSDVCLVRKLLDIGDESTVLFLF